MRRHVFRIFLVALLASIVRPAVAETTLTILTHYTDAQRTPLTACLRDYQRDHPGIRIVHQQSEIDDYLQTVLTARLSGTSPDIYNIYSIWSAQLIQAGILDRPPPEVGRLINTGYLPSTVDAIKVGGNVWGIPTEVNAFMLIYNKKLFRAAGITAPPRDWNEVVADATRMTRRNTQGKITTAGFAFGPTVANGVYPFVALLRSRGIEPFNARLDGTNLTTPDASDVLTDETRLFAKGITDNTIQVLDFPSGAVGMMIFANWFKATLQQAFGAAMDETVGVAPIPAGNNWKTLQYAFFWGVDANSPRKQEAWNLLAWLNSPRGANKQSCTGEMLGKLGALTGNRSDITAGPDDYGDAFSKPFVDAIASGRAGSLPNVVRNSEIQQELRLTIGRAWSGAQTPQAALQDADRKIKALLVDTN
ncbi:extracellular solute-binding protein [Rhodopila sp.]|uniref:extracellular solute-binding protein n=1 Tax=Rhodopila sp. TaxID=2480087 RepID=UPI003D1061E0